MLRRFRPLVVAFFAAGALAPLLPAAPASAECDTAPYFVAPASGATLAGTVDITVAAPCGNDWTIYLDGKALEGVITPDVTASIKWNTTATVNGPHTLVLDFNPYNPPEPTIQVTVANTPPVVAITAPTSGSVVSGVVTLAASVTPAPGGGGAVSEVTFYVDDTKIGSDPLAPYEYAWDTADLSDGNHELTARVSDRNGQTGTSRAVVVSKRTLTPYLAIDNSDETTLSGQPVQITGSLTDAATGDPIAGQEVKLQVSSGTSAFQFQSAAVSGPGGGVTFSYAPRFTTKYRLLYDRPTGSVASAVRLLEVRPGMTLKFTQSRVKRNTKTTSIVLTIKPVSPGMRVQFQSAGPGGAFRNWGAPDILKTATTRWSFTSGTRTGTFRYRVVFAGNTRLAASQSNVFTVSVVR